MVIAVRTERGVDGLEIVKEADSEVDRVRLQREAAMLDRAAQPGVVEVVSAGASVLRLRHRGTPVARLGPLPADQVAALVRAVADTVAALHRQGIAHGAIGTEHVVIGERGRPRLCSFGAASDADETTTADDVDALGHMFTDLLDAGHDVLWSPPHRGVRMAGRRRKALAAFRSAAAAAQRPDAAQRPTARQLATAIHEALPGLTLPEPAGHEATKAFAAIPDDVDPTGDLGWTDDDLSYLAIEHDADDDPALRPPNADAGSDPRPDGQARPDPYAGLAFLDDDWAGGDDADATRRRDPGFDDPDDDLAAGSDPDDDPPPPARPDAAGTIAPIRIRPSTIADDSPRRADRRVLVAVAAGVLVIGAVAGSVIARSVRPFGGETASVASTTSAAVPAAGAQESGDDEPAPTPPTVPASCPAAAVPGPDIDGDSCPEPVTLDDRIATVGSVQVELGQPGDLVTVADSDCDGVATPVVLRPDSGEVFVFPAWSLDRPLEVVSSTVVAGADTIDTASGSCPAVVVTGPGGVREVVAGTVR